VGVLEVLIIVAGVVSAVAFLIVPGASVRARLTGLGVGAVFVGYGIYAASQSGGVVLVPVGVFAVALVALVMLYQGYRDRWARGDVEPLPPGTPGARQCLSCGQGFAADVPGPCPLCRGTLAPATAALETE
jgi:hypothetical protein